MKTIIFDIHNTIAWQKKDTEYFIRRTYDEFRCEDKSEDQFEEYQRLWVLLDQQYQQQTNDGYTALQENNMGQADVFLREVKYQKKFIKIFKELKIRQQIEPLSKNLNDVFQAEWISGLDLFPNINEVLDEISRDFRCGIITNFRDSKWIMEWIKQNSLGRFFGRDIYISEDIGYRKPHPKIFAHMISQMDIQDVSDVVYVGDNAIEDKYGAERLGLRCVLIGKDISSVEFLPGYLSKEE